MYDSGKAALYPWEFHTLCFTSSVNDNAVK